MARKVLPLRWIVLWVALLGQPAWASDAIPPYLARLQQRDITSFDAIIQEAATYYALPSALLKAVIAVESGFVPSVISPKGAQGLMQLMPETATRMHVRDPMDAWENVFGGARYLRILANRFGGDLRRTIAAYNAGPEAVEHHQGTPPYNETKRYVRHVLALYQHYLGRQGK